jgi:hypothetical protein
VASEVLWNAAIVVIAEILVIVMEVRRVWECPGWWKW